MSFAMHKLTFRIADHDYEVPATDLSNEQVLHMIAYAVRVKIERAAATVANGKGDPHVARTKRIATVYDIDGTQRRSPVEAETINLIRGWLAKRGEKSESLKGAGTISALLNLAKIYLPDDPKKGTTADRVANLGAAMHVKAVEIVESRGQIDLDV